MNRGGTLVWPMQEMNAAILACECTYCGALPGHECTRPASILTPKTPALPHRPRVKAARIKLLETGNGR